MTKVVPSVRLAAFTTRSTTVIAALLALPAIIGCASPEQRRLWDDRDIISPAAEARITAFQEMLQTRYGIDFAIDIPRRSPLDIAAYAHDAVENRGIGAGTGEARGLLLVIDVDSRTVRMEVGPGLEYVFPDIFVSRVQRDQMAPFFADGRPGDGVEATVELLVSRVVEAIEQRDYEVAEDHRRDDLSSGAGAQQPAPIGDASDSSRRRNGGGGAVPAQPSPQATLSAYVDILGRRDARTDLGIYTPATRQLLATRPITVGQQKNEYRQLSKVFRGVRFVESDSFAVGLVEGNRNIPPYFFARSPEGWMLDLATASKAIRFDLQNRWFFAGSTGPYAFAFR